MRLKKTILILEDRDDERENLHGAFEDRGFNVRSAGTISAARSVVDELGEDLDVLLLDMVIEGSRMTGAELGLEVKERLATWPPEFLVHTAYPETHYIQLAFRLGASAYLQKPASFSEIVRQVRILALRRSLRLDRPGMIDRIETLAEGSRSKVEAIIRFCREVLCPELELTLGAPFVLLVSGLETECVSNGADLPARSAAYPWLNELVQLRSPSDPLIVQRSFLLEAEGGDSRSVLEYLDGAAFITLEKTEEFSLSLGVLQRDRTLPFSEDAGHLARALGNLIQPALGRVFNSITEIFLLLKYRRQNAVLEAISKFCLYYGQEQVDAFERALSTGALTYDMLTGDLERILILGENLRKAGELLALIEGRRAGDNSAEPTVPLSMAKLLCQAWSDLSSKYNLPNPDLLVVEGDCQVVGRPNELRIAAARLLQWLARRTIETPLDVNPTLKVTCSLREKSREAEVVFEDRSRRLPRKLRENLFSLFATPVAQGSESRGDQGEVLGLYLSKALVEQGHGGWLDDRSDEIPGELGHRFVMRLPS